MASFFNCCTAAPPSFFFFYCLLFIYFTVGDVQRTNGEKCIRRTARREGRQNEIVELYEVN